MNDARMTIRLPSEMLYFAQNYAKGRQITLSELVLRYFKRLKDEFASKREIPVSVRKIAGIIPKDVNVEKMYHEHAVEKYL